MDKTIIVDIEMFANKSKVSFFSPEEGIKPIGSYPIEQLPKLIVLFAYQNEAYNVKIARGKAYAEWFIAGIKEEEIKVYNSNKLEIEFI